MLTTVKSNSKKALSILLVFVMCISAFVLCNPIEADALVMGDYIQGRYYYYPEGTQFISSIRYGQATKSADTASEASADGHTVLTNDNGGGNLDFNSGVSGKDYIYLGYKTTTDINAALGTFLRMGHNNGGADTTTFTVDGNSVSFTLTALNTTGKQDLNADAGGDYIYLYYTNDTSVGLPIVSIAGTNDRNTSKDGYYTVTKNDSDTEASDCNCDAGGDYVYLFFDNSSVYSDITSTVNTLKDALAKTSSVSAESKYTAASWQTYQTALTEANRIMGIYTNRYNAGYATAAEITAAATALNKALDGLQTTITVDAATNGGTTTKTEYTVTCGLLTTVDFPAGLYTATREGYSFLGWNTDANATTGSKGTMAVPLASTVYAIFSVLKYNVYFFNPTTNQTIDVQSVEYGKDATAPQMETYAQKDTDLHYVFSGWDKEFTNITGGITVNAVYSTEEHSYVRTRYVAPTCKTKGSETYKCSDCDQEKTVELPIDSAAHNNTTDYPAKGSTCKEYGYTAYTYCNDCNKVVSGRELVPLADCSWTDWSVTEPTCTVDGVKSRKCTVCSKTESETISATGHEWGEWAVSKAATCEAGGRQQRTCPACSSTEVEIINALGHDYKDTVVAPSCTQQGYTTHTCARPDCGKSYTDSYVEATGHNWENVGVAAKEPSCTETGLQYQECTGCDASQTAVLDALGHDWQNENIITEADCDTDGLMGATCNRCGEAQSDIVIPALGHDWNEGTVVAAASCTENGTRRHTCKRDGCGKTMDVTIKATGHSWDDGVVTKETSCSEAGTKLVTCGACGETNTVDIPKLSHRYIGVITAPTCTEQGYTEYACEDCGDILIEDYVPAKGHSFSVTVVPPTCIKEGYTYARCSSCSHAQKTDFVAALGHSYSTTTVASTCTEKGYDLHVCSRGDSEYKDNYVDALGHDYSVTTVAPTCTEKGHDLHVCSRCDGKYKDNYVDALGHSFVEEERVEPQGTQSGYILYGCENCDYDYKEIIYSGNKALVCITIYDADGNPVAEAEITITNKTTGESYVIYTDLNGYFTEVLPEGAYELLIDKDGYDDTYAYIYVKNGEAELDIPTMNPVTCDCYCHQDNIWAKIFKLFMKLRMLFGLEVNCCANPQI